MIPRPFLVALFTIGLCSPLSADRFPDDLHATTFCGPDVTPSPACLCVSATGAVYAGVDLNGSLGKGPGKGRIIRLTDLDRDGIADAHTLYATIDNPRGLLSFGDRLYVLHTHFGDDGVATGMNLVVLEDIDQDGAADGPPTLLVEGICSATALNNRGTDHSTNGIQMGIDGWIYIAVGDFGFAGATGTDGTELTLLGGGIVRVRPDGSEMELFTTGMRNIYDVAIDPFLNVFTRGNTNDGGGWNVRFTHHLQSGEYGYPRLFIHFADEIIPALEDVGGGSGVGALFLSEPTWPASYNQQPLMADWGRKEVYLHRLLPDGASFQQTPESLLQVSQVSDLDVDPSGQLFLSAWDGAGFKGSEEKGYLVRVVPQGWKDQAFPDLPSVSTPGLVDLLRSESATARIHAQQSLLLREDAEQQREALTRLISEKDNPLASRVAALFTLAQFPSTEPLELLGFARDPDLREYALRAATDRLPKLASLPTPLPLDPFTKALQDGSARQRAAAASALGRIQPSLNSEAAKALLAVPYTKPAPEGKPTATPLTTLKGNRTAEFTLDVRPGQKLYFYLKETNPVETPSHLVLLNPSFLRPDRSTLSLTKSEPIQGVSFADQNPDGSELVLNEKQKKAAKKLKHYVTTPVASDPLIYVVPNGVVRFTCKASTSQSSPDGSIDVFLSVNAPDEASPTQSPTPRHATPNASVIVPHLAAQSLVKLQAVEDCLQAIGTPS
ncbi:MAG: hypothetical protein AAF191_08320, partial [Verrucomicrobiota bacterium]